MHNIEEYVSMGTHVLCGNIDACAIYMHVNVKVFVSSGKKMSE